MPKLDGLKEEIGIIKFWLGIVVAVFIAIAGWIVNSYKVVDVRLLACAFTSLLFLFIAIVVLNRAMMKKAKEIKDCKK